MNSTILDIYPLSPMQQGMLFHSLLAPESEVYSELISCKLIGALDIPAFREAWNRALNRHDILRSAFVWEDLDEPLQVVHAEAELPFRILDWSGEDEDAVSTKITALEKSERKEAIDLTTAPLMRITIIKLEDNVHHFIWAHHHLLFDGWGLPILLGEIFTMYEAIHNGTGFDLPPVRPYRDYIAWLQNQDKEEARRFWKERMSGFSAPTPVNLPGPSKQESGGYVKKRILLNNELSAEINRFARENQLTLNTILQGAWALLLSRYSREEDIVFGSTVSGRPADLPGSEYMLGLFINTLPIRIQVDKNARSVAWLQEIQKQQADIKQYEYSHLVDIQGETDVPRSMPLFDSIIVFENYPVGDALSQETGTLQIRDLNSFERTNYPLTLVSSPGKQIGIELAFESERFSTHAVERTLTHLEQIISSFASDPAAPVGTIDVLPGKEKERIVSGWSRGEERLPEYQTAQEWFEIFAGQFPDLIAARSDTNELRYDELNVRSNQLARLLQERVSGSEALIGISLDRSLEMIIGLLAVLKAGYAYVPIDPDYPPDRIEYMVKDSGIRLLITSSDLQETVSNEYCPLLFIEEALEESGTFDSSNPESAVYGSSPAYMIYTSGSTGKPKGVVLRHSGLCNLASNMIRDFKVDQESRILQSSSFSFDGSVAEIFLGLFSGACLYLIRKQDVLSTEKLVSFLNDNRITHTTLPPSLITLIPPDEVQSLQAIISVGDTCSWDLAERWKDKFDFFNGYGPTEITVGCTWDRIDERRFDSATVPIGRPLANVQVYILDERMKPVPAGVPGELFIGGSGVALGYHNRPGLTSEKFLPDPFSGNEGARLYKTGDLARFLEDGSIEFLGRVDFQVKLRGFRVELGEIEEALKQMPAVADAAVILREDTPGDKRIVGYLLAENGSEIAVQEVRNELKNRLPEFMVPSALLVMDSLPMTPSGKVDRKALPAPEQSDLADADEFVAPRTPEEELLAGIWSDVLHLPEVGVNSSFFDLGGHSLMATQVISRIKDAFQVDLPLRSLFESPTIAQLLIEITRLKQAEDGLEAPPLERVSRDQDLPLSFAQQRLWFLDLLEPGNTSYNIPTIMKLHGPLDTEILEAGLNRVIERHEALRTTFRNDGGKPVQVISDPEHYTLPVTDLSGQDEKAKEQELQRLAQESANTVFDLAEGPLFAARIIRYGADEHVLIFVIHHIIADGWSVSLLVREVAAFYDALKNEKDAALPDLKIQYSDYAAWQRNWLKDDVLEKQLDYWRNQLAGIPPLLEIPTDRPRPAVQTVNGAVETTVIPPELTTAVKRLSQQTGTTPFMTLLALFQTLLHRYSGQEDILVGSPIANRTNSEIEKLIGFFVNTLVFRARFHDELSFEDLLRQVRETALGAYAHQDLPFEKLVEEIQPVRDMSHSPLFQVAFVYQNIPPGQKIELSDLSIEAVDSDSGTTNYDITFTMTEGEQGLLGSMEYNTDLFDAGTIRRMLDQFVTLLGNAVSDPEEAVAKIPLMQEETREELLTAWNQTAWEFPADTCVHEWFEKHAAQQPDADALLFKSDSRSELKQLSYKTLNEHANQMARYLISAGLGHEQPAGICIERSNEMIISILAVLKTGGAFIPIDPTYPEERIRYMIEDSGLEILITSSGIVDSLPEHKAHTVVIDREWEAISREDTTNPDIPTDPDNLAYVIYTSGSTGKPKGTMLRHRGLCNLAAAQIKAFHVGPGSRIMQFSSLSFDAAVWEFAMAMLSGSALCLTSAGTIASGNELVGVLEDLKVTTITLPPSVLAVLPQRDLPDLSTIITAGEAVSGELVERWGDNRRFFNAYGPTETTVCASMHLCEGSYPQGPPIGLPIANFRLYVLDKHLQLVPIGVPGELCIAGMGLARGYLHKPELTAEKFIPDPFGEDPGSRLYRSGDLVRYLPDGNIEFLGRIDQQVKVRGFRIELGEIESVIDQHDGIADVYVMAREDRPGDKRLVAYLVTRNGTEIRTADLREHLRDRLPEYMIPSAFISLDQFPLTPSGKIDRHALPVPEVSRDELTSEYVAPRNEDEEKITAIVSDLLNVKKVGIHDNFFELGGHSLLATQFISRIRDQFGVELPLRSLFEHPNALEIVEEIQKAKSKPDKNEEIPTIKRVSRAGRTVKRKDLEN